MELMQGTLYELTRAVKLTESQIAYACKEVLHGILWLHENSRVHRDIKSDNILYDASGNIKITDFGFSAEIKMEKELRRSIVGTPSWMAPEIILGEGYNNKVDIWALGILVFELTEGTTPCSEGSSVEIMCDITNFPVPEVTESASMELRSFLALCLEKQPECRASGKQLLNHPFLLSSNKESFIEAALKNPNNIQN